MKSALRIFILFILAFSFTQFTFAATETRLLRFTGKDMVMPSFDQVLVAINQRTGFQLSREDFKLLEARPLATSNYEFWVQMVDGNPLKSRSIRIWTKDSKLLQAEAVVDSQQMKVLIRQSLQKRGLSTFAISQRLNSQRMMSLVRLAASQNRDDKRVFDVSFRDEWVGDNLVRLVKARGRHGHHQLEIDVVNGFVLSYDYEPFAQVEPEVPALVYPIYEEAEGSDKILERVASKLSNLNSKVRRSSQDIYSPLRSGHFWEDRFDPLLGEFPVWQSKGFWSGRVLKEKASKLREALTPVENTFGGSGMILDGKYVTINLHPDVATKFPNTNYRPQMSTQYLPRWTAGLREGAEVWEMIPGSSLLGQPLTQKQSAWDRPARRLADHNPTAYINDGFDEVQVYWAVDTFMTTLHEMGFTDPELSTRPFNAFLYDPDISMRDNAYYTDDTINFTTYSPKAQNFARDNSTIWHELGHGIMDRLMGDYIVLADTGGLSEGMADYLGQILVQYVSAGKTFEGSDRFRILNKIGFHLTNEVHDDGEAYGGSMNDFMLNAMKAQGQKGLAKAADLTMEAMRLTRNHPGLTAKDWFEHMLFADEVGSAMRRPQEMREYLLAALSGRNFRFDDKAVAEFKLFNGVDEVTNTSAGSRGKPIAVSIKSTEKASYVMRVKLTSSDSYKFNYPVQVRVGLENGPLQGAIHWEGQETQPTVYTLNSEADVLEFPLTAFGKCDQINREDGSCVDFAYVQIWNAGETSKPVAKKRFYLRIKTMD